MGECTYSQKERGVLNQDIGKGGGKGDLIGAATIDWHCHAREKW